jgi:hypothetical protein
VIKVKKRFMRLLLPIAVVAVLVMVFVAPVFAADYDTVTITATPTYIAMTLTPSSPTWALSTVVHDHTYYWTADALVPAEPLVDGDMKNTITNTGSVTEDIDIACATFTGGVGWTLSADETPGENEVNLRAGITGMANLAAMIQVEDDSGKELVDSLPAVTSNTIMWCMILETGTFTDGVAKEGVVTVTAVEHS